MGDFQDRGEEGRGAHTQLPNASSRTPARFPHFYGGRDGRSSRKAESADSDIVPRYARPRSSSGRVGMGLGCEEEGKVCVVKGMSGRDDRPISSHAPSSPMLCSALLALALRGEEERDVDFTSTLPLPFPHECLLAAMRRCRRELLRFLPYPTGGKKTRAALTKGQ